MGEPEPEGGVEVEVEGDVDSEPFARETGVPVELIMAIAVGDDGAGDSEDAGELVVEVLDLADVARDEAAVCDWVEGGVAEGLVVLGTELESEDDVVVVTDTVGDSDKVTVPVTVDELEELVGADRLGVSDGDGDSATGIDGVVDVVKEGDVDVDDDGDSVALRVGVSADDLDRVNDRVTEGDIVTDDVVDTDDDLDGVTVGDGFTHDVLPGLDT